MANEVGVLNSIAIEKIGSVNSIVASKMGAVNSMPFIAELPTYFIIGTTNNSSTPQMSLNNGTTWFDISIGNLSGTRGAAIVQGPYMFPHTRNKKNFIIAGYNSTSARCFVSSSQDGGVTWKANNWNSKYYEFTTLVKDASYAFAGQWTYNGYLRSTDWGQTWTEILTDSGPLTFATSNNGQYVYGGTGNTKNTIYRSTNYGASLSNGGTTTYQHKHVACDGTGQYVFAWNANSHNVWFSTNYGQNFTQLNTGTSGGFAGMFKDQSLFFYTVNTAGNANNGLMYSTNKGSTWTRVTFPAGWTTVMLSYSDEFKRIYINQNNTHKNIYKLNDAKNGWDLVYTLDSNVYGMVGCSEFRDEIVVSDANYRIYRITPAGVRVGPIYTGITDRTIPSIF